MMDMRYNLTNDLNDIKRGKVSLDTDTHRNRFTNATAGSHMRTDVQINKLPPVYPPVYSLQEYPLL